MSLNTTTTTSGSLMDLGLQSDIEDLTVLRVSMMEEELVRTTIATCLQQVDTVVILPLPFSYRLVE